MKSLAGVFGVIIGALLLLIGGGCSILLVSEIGSRGFREAGTFLPIAIIVAAAGYGLIRFSYRRGIRDGDS
jgi:hypothetical protein